MGQQDKAVGFRGNGIEKARRAIGTWTDRICSSLGGAAERCSGCSGSASPELAVESPRVAATAESTASGPCL